MEKKYSTIRDIGNYFPFSSSAIRNFIARDTEGFRSKCLIKIGSRNLIDLEGFDRWLQEHRVSKE